MDNERVRRACNSILGYVDDIESTDDSDNIDYAEMCIEMEFNTLKKNLE